MSNILHAHDADMVDPEATKTSVHTRVQMATVEAPIGTMKVMTRVDQEHIQSMQMIIPMNYKSNVLK